MGPGAYGGGGSYNNSYGYSHQPAYSQQSPSSTYSNGYYSTGSQMQAPMQGGGGYGAGYGGGYGGGYERSTTTPHFRGGSYNNYYNNHYNNNRYDYNENGAPQRSGYRPLHLRSTDLRPGDWICECYAHNYGSRDKCYKCGKDKTDIDPSKAKSLAANRFVRAGDWYCQCGAHNYASRESCYKCQRTKSEGCVREEGGEDKNNDDDTANITAGADGNIVVNDGQPAERAEE